MDHYLDNHSKQFCLYYKIKTRKSVHQTQATGTSASRIERSAGWPTKPQAELEGRDVKVEGRPSFNREETAQ